MTDVSKVIEDLQGAVEAENANIAQQGGGSRFTVPAFVAARSRLPCRFLVQHNFANGVPISGTEIAIVFGGQIAAKHPRLIGSSRATTGAICSRASSIGIGNGSEIGSQSAAVDGANWRCGVHCRLRHCSRRLQCGSAAGFGAARALDFAAMAARRFEMDRDLSANDEVLAIMASPTTLSSSVA